MKKIIASLMAGVLLVTLFAGCKQNNTPAADKDTYVIGLDPGFPPMGSKNESGEIIGFDIDLANAVAEELGITFTFKEIDWDSKEMEINSDKIDLIWNGFSITEERKEQYQLSKPYLKNSQVIVVAQKSDIQTIADLEGKEVLLQKESSALNAIKADPIYEKVELKEYPSNMDCFNDMKIGRGHAIVVDKVVAKYYIETMEGGENFRILEESLEEEDYAIGAKKGNTALIELIEGAIDKLVASGKTKELSEKWFGEDIFYWE